MFNSQNFLRKLHLEIVLIVATRLLDRDIFGI